MLPFIGGVAGSGLGGQGMDKALAGVCWVFIEFDPWFGSPEIAIVACQICEQEYVDWTPAPGLNGANG